MQEPVRGRWERKAAGAAADVIATEEPVPSFAESWRIANKVPTLRRIWWSLPFLAVSLVGFVVLASLMYEQEFGLDERARGVAAAIAEPFQLVGIVYGTRIAMRRYSTDFAGLLRFLAIDRDGHLDRRGRLRPGTEHRRRRRHQLCDLGGTGDDRPRRAGRAVARHPGEGAGNRVLRSRSLWTIPGLLILPFVGWLADVWTIRAGMMAMVPMFLIGSLVLRSSSELVVDDIGEVWRSMAARSEALYQRRQGAADLLLVRKLDAGYGDRQVLYGVDLDVREGEIVALLGTNGAGKSTLLKAIGGIVEADRGAVVLDGRDITHAPPNEIAQLGIAQVPGGAGVFGSLTVRREPRAGRMDTRLQGRGLSSRRRGAGRCSPCCAIERRAPPQTSAAVSSRCWLSAMAFVGRPRVLLIDELSLGLAPVIVGADARRLCSGSPPTALPSCSSSRVSMSPSPSPSGPTSWSVARSASVDRRRSSSNVPTSSARSSSPGSPNRRADTRHHTPRRQ